VLKISNFPKFWEKMGAFIPNYVLLEENFPTSLNPSASSAKTPLAVLFA